MQSRAKTVAAYLKALPPERRKVVAAVRAALRRHLPRGYEEAMAHGMISWQVPLARHPDTYDGKPLVFCSLAAQKHGYSLYLMCAYQDPKLEAALRAAFAKAGKRLDMGRSCVRFKTLDDLPLEAIARLLRRVPPERFLAQYEARRARA